MDVLTHATTAAEITARLDRLPMTRHLWKMVTLISLGGCFEVYDLFFSGYVAPGLFRASIFTPTTVSLFGMTGIASFIGALFAGLFVGTIAFSYFADRFGRRAIFTFSLVWYSIATLILAFQHTADMVNLWRFIGGIGIGVELVTIDTYISELVPKRVRGKAFAFQQAIGFCAVPLVALLAWLLVPVDPLGFSGWRWVVLIGSAGAVFIWWLRLGLPESPRWLAQQGRFAEAEHVMQAIETQVAADSHQPLPTPELAPPEDPRPGSYWEVFSPAYRGRAIMMIVANFCSTIGFYGFANWVPTLLIAKGIHVTQSLQYTFIMAFAYPLFALVGTTVRRSDGAQMAGRHSVDRHGGVRRGLLDAERCGRTDRTGVHPDHDEHLDLVLVPQLPGGTVSDPHAGACRRLRLFVEPVQHDLHRLLRCVLPEELRRARRVRLHRGGHGDRGYSDRRIRPAHQPPAAGGDLALTYRAGAWYQ